MGDFKTAYPDSISLDPNKRVNYTTGLVLGVDEFLQQEFYMLEKHRLHNRALHGYGTLCGLHVSQEDTANGVQIKVGPGIAVNPKGREIRVPQTQCALLNDWLERKKEQVPTSLASPPHPLEVYLVLCYTECKTDMVPIPGGPCLSVEDSSAASRIADAFELKIGFDPPEHTEDEAERRLLELLHQIEISAEPGDFITQTQLEDLVRGLGEVTSPPVASPPVTSPPNAWRMHPDHVRDFMSAAFRVWVTEVRPNLLEAGRNCAGGPPTEACVLLAKLEFDIEEIESHLRVSGEVNIDQTERPYLLQSRLLQEALLCMTTHPSVLSGVSNKIEKHVSLPPFSGRQILGSASITTTQGVPVIGYQQGGDATFTLPIPDDLDYSEPVRIRLIYTFSLADTAAVNVDLTWRIFNRSYSLNETLPTNTTDYLSVDFTETIPLSQRDTVLETDFINLPDPIDPDDRTGTLRIRLHAATPNTVSVSVLNVGMAYTADSPGR